MKRKISESIKVPEGIACTFDNGILTCKKDSLEVSRKLDLPQIKVNLTEEGINLEVEKGNKNDLKIIRTFIAHIANIFHGLQEKFVYELEAVNVHFPMTLKVEGKTLTVTNFLGEKKPRKVKILDGVEVEVNGQKIVVSSHNKEAAGQTAANLEKAGKTKGKDRRIFQDGIFITQKPKRLEATQDA
ncbi:MAG: 50S ribosomal protein L6 [Nanoarchaeota archaeon]|nr:50S ribosomal protein L6 [Nanoarchaeota archaeon]